MTWQYIYCSIAGFFISLSGSLPLGNLNVTAMHIAAKSTYKKALLFALGAVLVELLYLRFTLYGLGWVQLHSNIFVALRAFTILLFLVLAIGSFIAAGRGTDTHKNVVIDNKIDRFVLGVTMSALNPMQIPFWAGWAVYLFSSGTLLANAGIYNLFTLAAGVGTFAALLVFIYAGKRFSPVIRKHEKKVNIAMGILFLVMAMFQLTRFL